MTELLSNRALINALISIEKDIRQHRQSLTDPDIDEEEQANVGETILDMERAMGEFVAIYKDRCKVDSKLPALTKLLGQEWA